MRGHRARAEAPLDRAFVRLPEYLREYRRAAAAAIDAGFVLPADRKALLAFAEPALIQG